MVSPCSELAADLLTEGNDHSQALSVHGLDGDAHGHAVLVVVVDSHVGEFMLRLTVPLIRFS